uniref:SET domain-containing protein n=1 Tax=Kalanchoe fedtschenkoi TaxID=63787 RepID=A0A7N0UJR8_KALFE
MTEDLIQQLRSRATELLIREEWNESIQICTQMISLCESQIQIQDPNSELFSKIRKALAYAYSNRAESWAKLKNVDAALSDCDSALAIENTHFKTLMCKGKILLGLHKYRLASDCFKLGLLESQANGNAEEINGCLEKCKRLDLLAKSGVIDLSSWVLSGFKGRIPELGEYISPVEIRRSEISGRGLFAVKNVEVGGVILVTEAVAVARGVVPELSENGQLVIWSSFVEKVMKCVENCSQVRCLVSLLSPGEDEDELEVPDIDMHRPESELSQSAITSVEKSKILSLLDVNSMVESVAPAKVLGTNGGLYGVGLWVLPSYINHSCCPNVRRLHVGDHVIVVASRDIMAGEELTFAYFDVFTPLAKRREMLGAWGFDCRCIRCQFEEGIASKMEMSEIEIGLERGLETGNVVFKLEESMTKWSLRGKEKGFCRASFWSAYAGTYGCERMMRKWGRRIPPKEVVVESVADAVGSGERILVVAVKG